MLLDISMKYSRKHTHRDKKLILNYPLQYRDFDRIGHMSPTSNITICDWVNEKYIKRIGFIRLSQSFLANV